MRYLAVLFLCLAAFSYPGYAAPPVCNTGAEGTIIYNKDHKIVQFCNGAQWIGMVARIGDDNDTLADLSCANGEIAKWNGIIWACAADSAGTGGITALTGDVAASGSGSVVATVAANAIGSLEIADLSIGGADIANTTITLGKLSATGTPSATTYLRGDNTWATISTGLPALASANIWVGNGTNIATAVAMSGDATMTNAGVLSLGTGVVTTLEVLDSTVASADIAADTIAAVDIATGGVATTEILDNTITATDIAPDAITASELAANAVTASELATDAVTIPKLAATGTASATTYLRGDNTWATISTAAPVCTRRQGSTSGTSATATCSAGEVITGGGCKGAGANYGMYEGYPASTTTFTCNFESGTSSIKYAYAICCNF